MARACVFGCPNPAETCSQHGHPATRRQVDQRRGSAHSRGYTRQWDRAAKAFLFTHPLCGDRTNGQAPVMSVCREQRRLTLAYQVDHVIPHRGDPKLFWNQDNWQALCHACGARKSALGQ